MLSEKTLQIQIIKLLDLFKCFDAEFPWNDAPRRDLQIAKLTDSVRLCDDIFLSIFAYRDVFSEQGTLTTLPVISCCL